MHPDAAGPPPRLMLATLDLEAPLRLRSGPAQMPTWLAFDLYVEAAGRRLEEIFRLPPSMVGQPSRTRQDAKGD